MLTKANTGSPTSSPSRKPSSSGASRSSAELAAAASRVLAGGVTSNWQITQPQPVWLSHGAGGKVYDADGNEYVDLHGGYGAALAGHAHPAIVSGGQGPGGAAAPTSRSRPRTRSSVAGELARRWGLPRWRFANSGTEATMDAVHLMRSYTGRDLIIKVEGGYHGHHDSVQVSVMPDADEAGPRERPNQVPSSSGIPRGDHQPHADRPVQRPGQRRQAPRRTPRPGRRHDRRADHDERRASSTAARLPGRPAGPPARPRRAAHVRRGQDRPHRRPRRRDRAVGRHAGPRLPGQVARRRGGGRRDRRHRRR